MGYVFPTSLMDKLLEAKTQEERTEAFEEMMEGYNRYREGMRSGLFGLVIGLALFPKSKDKKL